MIRIGEDMRALRALIAVDLRSRWSGGILTWSWALLQPMAQISLYAIVFSTVMIPKGVAFPTSGSYVIYLCSGFFCWLGISETLTRGSMALLEGAALIRSRGLPLRLFPLRSACTAWLLALVGFAGTLFVAPLAGIRPSWVWLLLPIPVLALVLTSAGMAMLLAPLVVLARDVIQIIHLCLPLVFWATPIVYETAILPPWFKDVQAWNPLVPAIDVVHCLLVQGHLPAALHWVAMAAPPVIAMGLGWMMIWMLDSEVRDAL